MRVCMAYTGGLTPRKGGGVASVINNVVRNTADKIEYCLLTVYDKDELEEIREIYPSTVKIEYVDPAENVFLGFMRYLVKEVGDFDVLHFHDFPFGRDLPLVLKTRLRGKNIVYSHHISLEELTQNRLAIGYYYSFFSEFGRVCSKVIAHSEYIANNDLGRFRSLKGKVHLIRNGVDLERINSAKQIDLDGRPAILFVGHLIPRKGIDILLGTINMLTLRWTNANLRLHVVGSGALEDYCRKYVIQHGLSNQVRFWGSVPESSKLGMIKGADIVVVPSRYENAPIVLLEAMAAGKPVIVTNVGGIPEVFKHDFNGILADPSSRQIATAIETLCENERLAEEYGRNNQEAAKSFDWKKIAQSYVRMYNSILK